MSKSGKGTDGSTEFPLRPLVFVTLSIVLACIAFAWVMLSLWYEKPEQRGVFGDMFGALNTLFSGLAFAGVIYAILLQRQELKLQRDELEATREELSRSAAAQEQSQAALKEQVLALNETVRISQASLLPEVIIYSMSDESRPTIILLIVENIGRGVARNVTFAFPADMPHRAWGVTESTARKQPEPMRNGPLVTGIPFLPPGGKRKLSWGQYGGLKSALGKRQINITASFQDIRGKPLPPIESIVEVESFAFTDAVDPDGARQAARHLEKIARDIGHITSGFMKPVVLVQSKQEHDRELLESFDVRRRPATNPDVTSLAPEPPTEPSLPPTEVSHLENEWAQRVSQRDESATDKPDLPGQRGSDQ